MLVRRFVSVAVLLGLSVFLCFFTGPSVTRKVDAQSVQIVNVGQQVDDARAELGKIEPPTRAFVLISKIVRPSVVTVLTKSRTQMQLPRFFQDDDEWPFPGPNPFRQRQDDGRRRGYEREVQGMGSGFFVDAAGDILTNNHVVEGAYEIKVLLADRSSYDATIVGRDPKSDLAVIRIKDCPAEKVVAARLGDSDQLEPGDWVLAVGAPFGLPQSVSAGIVSAKGRANVLPERPNEYRYQDFIQTDAAINRGNSGGPLVNYKAEVIGINTAIATQTGAYEGVGFAIPSNMAKHVMEQLIASGRIIRGHLGVRIGDVTEEEAKKLGLAKPEGVLVAQVLPDTPAAKAGLQAGDVIIAIDGKPMLKTKPLRNLIADTRPGTKVTLRVIREGKQTDLPVTIEAQPGDEVAAETETQQDKELGITVETLTPEAAETLAVDGKSGVYKGREGVLVTGVTLDGPADRAGIEANDLIYKVAGKRVANTDEYFEARKGLSLEKGILIEKRTGDVAKRVVVR